MNSRFGCSEDKVRFPEDKDEGQDNKVRFQEDKVGGQKVKVKEFKIQFASGIVPLETVSTLGPEVIIVQL
jgi:hypothetical protein